MLERRKWRSKSIDQYIVDENPTPPVSYIFNATTPRELFDQVIGAASSTRFWNGLPDLYPYGAGDFLEEKARALGDAAMENFSKIQQTLPTLLIETEKVLCYNDETLQKVADALRENGLSDNEILDCINSMQNQGILFRERFPNNG